MRPCSINDQANNGNACLYEQTWCDAERNASEQEKKLALSGLVSIQHPAGLTLCEFIFA